MKKEHLETFNDAVIAIIITLMVLEIRLPEVLADNIFSLARHIGIYGLSFIVVAIVWLNLRTMLIPLERIGHKITWLNLLVLFFVSLIPLPTQALGEHFHQKESHIFYGLVLTSVSFSLSLFHWQVAKNAQASGKPAQSFKLRKNWINLLYPLSILLAFISVYLSTCIFILMPALYFLPSHEPKEDAE